MFEVGKKVIAIKNSSDGTIRKGTVYPLNAIRKTFCKCDFLIFDVGLRTNLSHMRCSCCGTQNIPNPNGINWKASEIFAPYDDSLSSITVEQLLEQVEGTAGVLL